MASSKKLQLKLMFDKKNKKIIFAESDKEFVDVLFSFLTMPIGNIIHLLGGESSIGSMDMLYESAKNLDENYFNTKACKSMLLNPLNSSRSHYTDLILRVDSDNPRRMYKCKNPECTAKLFPFFSSSLNAKCGCGEIMSHSATFVDKDWKGTDGDGIFVKGNNTYMISDDMNVMSTSLAAIQNVLDKLEIKDLDDIEESHIDLDECLLLDLLKRSLISKSPLSGIYFQEPIATSDSEFISKLLPKIEMGLTDKSKISLTANLVICKSSNAVLYVESIGEELADLLLSFLTYPLGSIIKLLNKYSSLGCIDNLYRSADANFVKSELTLLNPELAPFFGCSASLSLIDEMSAGSGTLTGCSTCHINNIGTSGSDECKHGVKHVSVSEMNPKLASPSKDCGGGYAKKGVKFVITDDLELSPSSALSIMRTIKKHKFNVANLEEKEIEIGENEALSLLKACLTSKNPLSDVFGTNKKMDASPTLKETCIAPLGKPGTPTTSPTLSHNPVITWISAEQTWVHSDTEMRYKPNDGTYFKFVSEKVGEERHLYYQTMGDALVITSEGIYGDWNKQLSEDTSWDRKFIYSCDSADYVAELARHFSGFLHVVGPGSSDDDVVSSSDEGD